MTFYNKDPVFISIFNNSSNLWEWNKVAIKIPKLKAEQDNHV